MLFKLLTHYKKNLEVPETHVKEVEERFNENLDNLLKVKFKDKKEYKIILIDEIIKIDYREDFSLITIRDAEYLYPITKIGLEEILEGRTFKELDRDLYVNVSHIKKIHSDLNLLLFDDVGSVKEAKENKLPLLYINSRYMSYFKKQFGKEKDLAYKLEQNKTKNAKNLFSFKKNVADELF